MRVLLISTYELGHQPLHVASPAAALLDAGHDVRAIDTSVEPWDGDLVDWAEAVALSVPMHTAMRLALRVTEGIKGQRSDLPVCFYGLYAAVGRDQIVGRLADRVIAGEYEAALVAWVDSLDGAAEPPATAGLDDDLVAAREAVSIELGRSVPRLPARHLLPPLDRYAHLALGGEERQVGYVEASHGCISRCRHCPVPVVYDGRTRIVGEEAVVADVEQLVAMGARHITFGDPDFLSGPQHSLRVVRAVHERFPDLTFDVTTKVELILRHEGIWSEMAAAGCLFVVSAFESVDDLVLHRLDKGHTAADAARVVALLRDHGIEVRPSWLPFTPWTSPASVADILEFVADLDLVGNVDPVQFTIRLLLPDGSLLLDRADVREHLVGYDPDGLSWTWTATDPTTDLLQAELAALVAEHVADNRPVGETFAATSHVVGAAAGRSLATAVPAGATTGRPRLTEPWFC